MTVPMNVLFILSDQHRADAAGFAGHSHVQTPNLDRIAASGHLFERAYCSNPLCVPSRTSLLTGRYSFNHGAYSLSDTFPDNMPTYAHLFAAAGYDTFLSGRMHFVWNDRLHGFARRGEPEPYKNIVNCPDWWRQPMPEYDMSVAFSRAGIGESRNLLYDRRAHRDSLKYIRDRSREPGPWMMTACFTIPHEPFQAPEELYEMYGAMNLEIPDPVPEGPQNPMLEEMYQSRFRYTSRFYQPDSETIRKCVCAYYGLITAMDTMIGELIAALEETGQLENTVIVYSSDHGEMLGERGCWFKSVLYESAIRVPLIIRHPGYPGKGKRLGIPVSHVDLFPTCAELLGFRDYGDVRVDGKSLMPLLENPDRPDWDRPEILCEYGAYGYRTPLAAAIGKEFKFTYAGGFDPILINLRDDPHELRNKIDDPQCESIAELIGYRLHQVWPREKVLGIIRDTQASFELIRKAHEFQGLIP